MAEELVFEAVGRDGGGGVVRIGDDHQLGRACDLLGDLRKVDDVSVLPPLGHVPELRARDERPAAEDGIAGIGHEHRLPLVHDRKRDVREPLLRAEQRDDLTARVDLHAVPPPVPRRHRVLELGGVADRVDIVAPVLRGGDQRVDDVLRGRDVGGAHAQVHHMPALRELLLLHAQQHRKDALAETVHAFSKFHVSFPLFTSVYSLHFNIFWPICNPQDAASPAMTPSVAPG